MNYRDQEHEQDQDQEAPAACRAFSRIPSVSPQRTLLCPLDSLSHKSYSI